jgi:hypothetical protein
MVFQTDMARERGSANIGTFARAAGHIGIGGWFQCVCPQARHLAKLFAAFKAWCTPPFATAKETLGSVKTWRIKKMEKSRAVFLMYLIGSSVSSI